MSTPGNPYYDQLRLLVQLLSFVRREECFALKGGTAINLFYRDLPRYSVDIDLTYLPGEAYAEAQRGMGAALARIADSLSDGSPSYPVTRGRGKAGGAVDTLMVGGAGTQVKIEVNPVLRGTLHPVREMQVHASVSKEFGFAEAKVLAFDDVYAGKLVAALDRQHPRDLFDVKLLLEQEGISDALFRTFLVYLVGHHGSIPDVLDPLGKQVDFEGLYKGQFEGMTAKPVALKTLLETRERLAREIRSRLSNSMKRFLLSVQRGKPEWDLLGVKGAASLPAVKWRMHNLGKMNADAMNSELSRLEKVLAR
jgi:predicted nucleotidyltransferase component of viral defense system